MQTKDQGCSQPKGEVRHMTIQTKEWILDRLEYFEHSSFDSFGQIHKDG
jgi:hypothetical protein